MDSEFSWTQGPPETNSITATMVTRLNDAEEKRFRELLAAAWDAGYAAGRSDGATNYGWGADIPEANPYRD